MHESADGRSVANRWIGKSVTRVEDKRLLTGRGQFVDDMQRSGLLHASFVRSPIAAGRIRSVDLTAAQRMPGVCGAFDADALGVDGIRAVLDRVEFQPSTMPILATDQVRHVGEAVAVVVAESPYLAEDGADAVVVQYDLLQPTPSIDTALAPGAALVHEGVDGNQFLDVVLVDDTEIDEVLADAALVVEATFESSRVSALPMEGRACLGEWDSRARQLVLHSSTQVPNQVRTAVCQCLSIDESELRVLAPDVGGGFGLKCVVGREEVAVTALARLLGRPVKWIEDRRENLSSSFQGHEQRHVIKAGFDKDGRMLALDAEIFCDAGAYSAFPFTGAVEALMAAGEMPGPYKFSHYRVRTHAVSTNKAPMAPYRGVSRPQLTMVMERVMDKASRALKLEPVEIRKRNLIASEDFPYSGLTGIRYDKGSYRESLELCARLADDRAWHEKVEAGKGEGRLLGIGYACFSERTGYGTSVFADRKMGVTPGYEISRVSMDPSGMVTVATGTCSQGQGHETTIAQIVAEELGIDINLVRVRQGDTNLVPHGWGTFASRSIVIGGGAAKAAAAKLGERLRLIASHFLEAPTDDLELRDGSVGVRGSLGAEIALAELARLVFLQSHRLPPDIDPSLEFLANYDPPGTFSNATHGVLVELNRNTGGVAILDYVVVEDCGIVINPLIVEGQVRGGVAQGVAAALYEALIYDHDGQFLTGTLMDYLVPTAAEIPTITMAHLETPSELSLTGAKGMGEGGAIGAPAAILNAVNAALDGHGGQIDRVPIKPEYVLTVLSASPEGDPT